MIKTTTYIDVQFYDLDPMNIVWHGNYIKYLEQARCEMFDKMNYSYMDMYKDGFMCPIVKMDMKYIKPLNFGDRIRIECELEEIEPSIIIKYTIYSDKTDEKIFTAKSMQMCVELKTNNTIYEVPKNMKEKIKEYEKCIENNSNNDINNK